MCTPENKVQGFVSSPPDQNFTTQTLMISQGWSSHSGRLMSSGCEGIISHGSQTGVIYPLYDAVDGSVLLCVDTDASGRDLPDFRNIWTWW